MQHLVALQLPRCVGCMLYARGMPAGLFCSACVVCRTPARWVYSDLLLLALLLRAALLELRELLRAEVERAAAAAAAAG